MSWASQYIELLKQGTAVEFRPRGNSMVGKINSGDLVKVEPLAADENLTVGMIVLCRVKGSQFLHLVSAVRGRQYQISNNFNHVNGWTTRDKIYGRVVSVST